VYRVLSVAAGPLQGEEYIILDRVQIGRSGDIAVQLIGTAVSRHHAEIRIEANGAALLVDLSSRNGTFVKGERIDERVLRDGDRFEIDTSSFRFEEREGEPPDSQNELQISLMSGPAEDVTEIFQRTQPGDALRPTTLPREARRQVVGCEDPLHALAADKGWRFCPVCGEPPVESITGELAITPRTDAES
jgi:hypothetical protein